MKALKVIAWGIIAISSAFGAIDIADRVESVGESKCARVVTIDDFSIWLSQHPEALIDYRDGEWHDDREGRLIGTSPSEDSSICLAKGVEWH